MKPTAAVSAILFDASGTLLDDLRASWKAANLILQKFGRAPLALETFRRRACEPHWRFFTNEGIDQTTVRDVVPTVLKQVYDAHDVKPFPEVPQALRRLGPKGFHLGVVSQTPRAILLPLLERYSLASDFEVVMALEDCAEEKPSPAPILEALSAIRLPNPWKAAYVGDMKEDVVAARAAGIVPISVSRRWSYHTAEVLRQENPRHFIHRISDLSKVVGGRPY